MVLVSPGKLGQCEAAPANQSQLLYLYIIFKLDGLASSPYSVVYVHTGADEAHARPNVMWLRQAYERC